MVGSTLGSAEGDGEGSAVAVSGRGTGAGLGVGALLALGVEPMLTLLEAREGGLVEGGAEGTFFALGAPGTIRCGPAALVAADADR